MHRIYYCEFYLFFNFMCYPLLRNQILCLHYVSLQRRHGLFPSKLCAKWQHFWLVLTESFIWLYKNPHLKCLFLCKNFVLCCLRDYIHHLNLFCLCLILWTKMNHIESDVHFWFLGFIQDLQVRVKLDQNLWNLCFFLLF